MKSLIKGTPWYIHAVFFVSLGLTVAGLLLPPIGKIDNSILAIVGEIFGGSALLVFVVNIPVYLEAGIKAKISHGATSVTVAADEVKDSELDG